MKLSVLRRRLLCAAVALIAPLLFACAHTGDVAPVDGPEASPAADASGYLIAVEDEPDTVDFQCTTMHYTVALNAFNRLVEMEISPDGQTVISPSLAEAWEVSEDGLRYTFRLRDGVRFSNGSALSSSDVLYTFTRLLTHPDGCNRDIAEDIAGAMALERGEAQTLSGFEIVDDRTFVVTLEQPFMAFLACLSMPGASILDAESTEAAGARFGHDPAHTVGTGPFTLEAWEAGKGMLFAANPDCWAGPPACAGLDIRFVTDSGTQVEMFEKGELDILDLDNLGDEAEYFIHGDIYRDRLYEVPHIAISYIALNESVAPLNDARVRRALQLALDRQTLLDAVYSGRGTLENGILPHGLFGFNPALPEIPFDPGEARRLLAEAGYEDGFDLEITLSAASTKLQKALMAAAADMWTAVGVRTRLSVLADDDFMALRKRGGAPCYTGTWSADYNDPDNFMHTFFGSRENTAYRSLCYDDDAVIARVHDARAIVDEAARLREYRALEEKIIQWDAAWIPLFSRTHFYVVSERMAEFHVSWNGWYTTRYMDMKLK